MKKKKTKVSLPVSLNKELSKLIDENVTNRSKYIEYLIYKDFIENNIDGIKNILL
jgi:metal-responsive CopG/Arc/MetJ family transcriptional regulator